MSSYHLSNHHDIGSQVLVDSEDVEDPNVPEDDVHAVDDASVAHRGLVLQPQQQTQQEDGDGHQVCDVPVILQPHVDLLLQLPRLRHQDLTTEQRGGTVELDQISVLFHHVSDFFFDQVRFKSSSLQFQTELKYKNI